MHIYTDAWRGRRSVSDALRLRLQAVVRCLTWVVEIKLMTSARAACIVSSLASVIFKNHCTFSLFFYLCSACVE